MSRNSFHPSKTVPILSLFFAFTLHSKYFVLFCDYCICKVYAHMHSLRCKPESTAGLTAWVVWSLGALSPCAPGHPVQRGCSGIKDHKAKICPHCSFFQTHDPRSRLRPHFCLNFHQAPSLSLAIAAVVHRKFVKTHTIPQTPQFQQISIFLLKPVLCWKFPSPVLQRSIISETLCKHLLQGFS